MKTEQVMVRLPEGTRVRIEGLLKGGELLSMFVRAAVEEECLYREQMKREQAKAG